LSWSNWFSCSLFLQLLDKSHSNRLGTTGRGFEDVKAHNFFKSINWNHLEKGIVEPPFRPNVSHGEEKGVGEDGRVENQWRERRRIQDYVEALESRDYIEGRKEKCVEGRKHVHVHVYCLGGGKEWNDFH